MVSANHALTTQARAVNRITKVIVWIGREINGKTGKSDLSPLLKFFHQGAREIPIQININK